MPKNLRIPVEHSENIFTYKWAETYLSLSFWLKGNETASDGDKQLFHRADSTRELALSSEWILLGCESMLTASESLLLCGLE